MINIIGDLHTHTVASSHAYSTVHELLIAACHKRLKLLAVTDHGPALPDSPHEWHFGCFDRLPKEFEGVRLLGGCEANILPGGDLDLPDKILHKLDFVIASMHSITYPVSTFDENTRALIKVASNPAVDCLGHAGQATYPFDIPAVVGACKESGAIFEINSSSFAVREGSSELCRKIALECKRQEVGVAVTSDAHSMHEVGEFTAALKLLDLVDFPEKLVVNASLDNFSEFQSGRSNSSP